MLIKTGRSQTAVLNTRYRIRKIRHFVVRNILRGWLIRFAHLLFVLILIVGFNLSKIQSLNFSLNQAITLPELIHYFAQIDYSLLFGILGIIAILVFNIAWFIHEIGHLIVLFIITLVVTNVLGICMIPEADLPWMMLQLNLFNAIHLIYTSLQVSLKFEEENKLVKRAFSKYIHPELLEDLITSPNQLDLGGEQKEMTVLFCDLRGFTSLAEQLPPKFLIQLLNQYFDEMSQIIINHEGTIDKYMGDAIMAFWGAPIADPHHAEHAIEAAIQMREKLRKLKQVYPEFKGLKMGIGINSGRMIVGNVGSRKRFDYTVLGDNVNLSARLESLTKKYNVDILITENVLKELARHQKHLIFRLVDQILVKGKTQPIKIYQPMLNNALNQELKQEYESGFCYYQNLQFEEAETIFSALSEQGDCLARFMEARIPIVRSFLEFNGIWNWNEK
jgi:class 3 adenylate cyclase